MHNIIYMYYTLNYVKRRLPIDKKKKDFHQKQLSLVSNIIISYIGYFINRIFNILLSFQITVT